MKNKDFVKHNCDHYEEERFNDMNHRKFGDKEVDVCIVGAGAAGGTRLMSCLKPA